MKPIYILGIDLADSMFADNFYELDLSAQLNLLKKIIIDSYNQLKAKNPNAHVVVAWREYGAANKSGFLKRAIDKNKKKIYKECLQELSQGRDLTIIAGTVSTYKSLAEVKDVRATKTKILDAYEKFAFVSNLAEQEKINNIKEYTARLIKNFKTFQLMFENSCFVFAKGQQVASRKKVAPTDEMPADIVYKNEIYPLVYAFKKDISNFNIEGSIANVEICLEHSLGVLKYLVDQQQLEKPRLQFIVSASANINPEYCVGDYIIHFDSNPNNRISFIVNHENYDLQDLKVFSIDPYNYPSQMLEVEPTFLQKKPSLTV